MAQLPRLWIGEDEIVLPFPGGAAIGFPELPSGRQRNYLEFCRYIAGFYGDDQANEKQDVGDPLIASLADHNRISMVADIPSS